MNKRNKNNKEKKREEKTTTVNQAQATCLYAACIINQELIESTLWVKLIYQADWGLISVVIFLR